jgi:hypothetical protein
MYCIGKLLEFFPNSKRRSLNEAELILNGRKVKCGKLRKYNLVWINRRKDSAKICDKTSVGYRIRVKLKSGISIKV